MALKNSDFIVIAAQFGLGKERANSCFAAYSDPKLREEYFKGFSDGEIKMIVKMVMGSLVGDKESKVKLGNALLNGEKTGLAGAALLYGTSFLEGYTEGQLLKAVRDGDETALDELLRLSGQHKSVKRKSFFARLFRN
jgi:hypothetical protein